MTKTLRRQPSLTFTLVTESSCPLVLLSPCHLVILSTLWHCAPSNPHSDIGPVFSCESCAPSTMESREERGEMSIFRAWSSHATNIPKGDEVGWGIREFRVQLAFRSIWSIRLRDGHRFSLGFSSSIGFWPHERSGSRLEDHSTWHGEACYLML